MFVQSVFEASESNILFSTILAGEAIDQIRASTADVLHAVVRALCMVTDNDA